MCFDIEGSNNSKISSRYCNNECKFDISAGEDNPKAWLNMDEGEMERLGTTIKDQNLRLTLAFGIGNMKFSFFRQLENFLTFF